MFVSVSSIGRGSRSRVNTLALEAASNLDFSKGLYKGI